MCKVLRYSVEHEEGLLDLMKREPQWNDYTNPRQIEVFRKSLLEGDALVCKDGRDYCGYLRAITDGLGLYISELYVAPSWRNRGVGRRLLEVFKQQHIDREVYVLSDEDAYYEKLGHRKIGSIFEIASGPPISGKPSNS